jgi:type I restriction enzyme S subunit
VESLLEYRTSLITAAVTGQIDVAAWRKHGETNRQLEMFEVDMDMKRQEKAV